MVDGKQALEKIEKMFQQDPEAVSCTLGKFCYIANGLLKDANLQAKTRILSAADYVYAHPDAESIPYIDLCKIDVKTPSIFKYVLHEDHPIDLDLESLPIQERFEIQERYDRHRSLKGDELVNLVGRALYKLVELEMQGRVARLNAAVNREIESPSGPFQFIRNVAGTVQYGDTLHEYSDFFKEAFGYIYDILLVMHIGFDVDGSMKALENCLDGSNADDVVELAVSEVRRQLKTGHVDGPWNFEFLRVLEEDPLTTQTAFLMADPPENLVLVYGLEGFDPKALVDYFTLAFEKRWKTMKSDVEWGNRYIENCEMEILTRSRNFN